MKIQKNLKRSIIIESPKIENEILEFSFSSEEPVERYFGLEILSHKNGAMDMTRLKNKAALLFNHDWDTQLGVVEDAWIGNDKRGYCRVKLSKSAFAQDKIQDIKDGILVNVSFGYEIKAMQLVSEEKDKLPEYLVTEFQPFEISFVTVPADITVGIGRAKDSSEEIEITVDRSIIEEKSKKNVTDPDDDGDDESEDDTDDDETRDDDEESDESEDDSQEKSKEIKIEIKEQKSLTNERDFKMELKDIQAQERERILSINKLVEKHGERELAQKFIEEGKDAKEFAFALVDKLGGTTRTVSSKGVELTEKDMKNYSLSRAILAAADNKWDKAGFEKEISDEISKSFGRSSNGGFFMPTNVQTRATYAAGTAAYGGNLVQTSVLGDQFIDVLRNRARVIQAGATVLSGLTSNIAIPRKNGRSSMYWVAENGTITESEATFDQVAFSPKIGGAYSVLSRQLLQQANISVDAMVADDLNKEVALGVDAAAISGTGAGGQPKGILNQSGIGSVAIGTNGGALTFDHLIQLETAVATSNADVDQMAYMTNAKQIGVLKTSKASGSGVYLWSSMDNGSPAQFNGPKGGEVGMVNGYSIYRTNQVPATYTKGTGTNLSAVVFGDWSQLVIAQFMPGIEIMVNPYGTSQFQAGQLAVRALTMVDVNVKLPAAFAALTDAT